MLVLVELIDSEGGLIGSEEKDFGRMFHFREATIPANESLIGFKIRSSKNNEIFGIAPMTAENI